MTRLTILHNTDLHGRAEQVLRIAALANEIKQEVEPGGGHCVLWDAGDAVELNPPLLVKHTIIAQAGDYGRFLGQLELTLDSHTGKVVSYQGTLLPVTDTLPIDPAARRAYEFQQVEVRKFTARVTGTATHPIDLAHDRECAAGNLLADALRERMQGEVGLALSGHWQSGLPNGEITMSALYDACRSTANPGVAQLTGRQIRQFLQRALKPDNMQKSPNGVRGVPIGMPHVSAISVHYNPAQLDTLEVKINHEPLQPARLYRVAASDMELSDFISYLTLPHESITYELPTIMSEVLEDYLMRHSPIGPFDQRFSFLGE